MLAIWNLNLSCMTLNKPFSLPAPLFPGEKCSNSTPHSQEDHCFGRFPGTVATGSGKGFGQREYPAGVCWGGSDTKFAGLNPSSTLQLCFSDKKKKGLILIQPQPPLLVYKKPHLKALHHWQRCCSWAMDVFGSVSLPWSRD